MTTSLSVDLVRNLIAKSATANSEFAATYPGETGRRQPVHTVYGGAHLFKSDSAARLGALALRSLDQFAPDFLTFAQALDIPVELAPGIYQRVNEKLHREPVEDFRIDYEAEDSNKGEANSLSTHSPQLAKFTVLHFRFCKIAWLKQPLISHSTH